MGNDRHRPGHDRTDDEILAQLHAWIGADAELYAPFQKGRLGP